MRGAAIAASYAGAVIVLSAVVSDRRLRFGLGVVAIACFVVLTMYCFC